MFKFNRSAKIFVFLLPFILTALYPGLGHGGDQSISISTIQANPSGTGGKDIYYYTYAPASDVSFSIANTTGTAFCIKKLLNFRLNVPVTTGDWVEVTYIMSARFTSYYGLYVSGATTEAIWRYGIVGTDNNPAQYWATCIRGYCQATSTGTITFQPLFYLQDEDSNSNTSTVYIHSITAFAEKITLG